MLVESRTTLPVSHMRLYKGIVAQLTAFLYFTQMSNDFNCPAMSNSKHATAGCAGPWAVYQAQATEKRLHVYHFKNVIYICTEKNYPM